MLYSWITVIDLLRVQASKWKIRKRLKGGKPFLTALRLCGEVVSTFRAAVVDDDDGEALFPFDHSGMMEQLPHKYRIEKLTERMGTASLLVKVADEVAAEAATSTTTTTSG